MNTDKNHKTGILLINLGTPNSTSKKEVRAYLKQFLMDPRVIDLPWLVRTILINFLILPFRTKNSAHAYQQIWTKEGSPLLINSRALAAKLQTCFGDDVIVETGMRYGSPSIVSAIRALKQQCSHIIILPLFPQYSSAATGSAIEETLDVLKSGLTIPSFRVISDFYDREWFINPWAELIKIGLEKFKPDFLLFSYHGLPERQIEKSGCGKIICDRFQECPAIHAKNRFCYRAQCFATTRALSEALQLNSSQFATGFQSRFGRTPWIKPHTDEMLNDLYQKGIRRLAIACPSFTADCLETLEEIGIRAREQWLSMGGAELILLPCLNADGLWIKSLSSMLESSLESFKVPLS